MFWRNCVRWAICKWGSFTMYSGNPTNLIILTSYFKMRKRVSSCTHTILLYFSFIRTFLYKEQILYCEDEWIDEWIHHRVGLQNYDYRIVLMHCFIATIKVYKCYSWATRIRNFSHTNYQYVHTDYTILSQIALP